LPAELKIKLLVIGSIEDDQTKVLFEKKESNVMLLPPQKDLKPFYNISDIIVLPSREDPFPYVMLEAGAMKKPLIGSRVGGIEEFIQDGANGLLFESGNTTELVEKILYFINNPIKAKELGEALYEKVKLTNTCEEYFNKLRKIYSEI
jgi:glycosyltransferase involved in cell wall biosynthesis